MTRKGTSWASPNWKSFQNKKSYWGNQVYWTAKLSLFLSSSSGARTRRSGFFFFLGQNFLRAISETITPPIH